MMKMSWQHLGKHTTKFGRAAEALSLAVNSGLSHDTYRSLTPFFGHWYSWRSTFKKLFKDVLNKKSLHARTHSCVSVWTHLMENRFHASNRSSYQSLSLKSSRTFATDQNSFPIFGRVFCRTHLIPLLILSSTYPPFFLFTQNGTAEAQGLVDLSQLFTEGSVKSLWPIALLCFYLHSLKPPDVLL